MGRLILTGTVAADLPSADLEELAGTIGNSAMAELIAAQTPEPELHGFRLGALPVTEPFEASVDPPALTSAPSPDTAVGSVAAASPGAFAYGG